MRWPIDWPVRRKLARPRPAPPSSRVYAAFAVAAILGLTIFLIWWLTSGVPVPPGQAEKPGLEVAANPDPAPAGAALEASLPRGGSLTGSADSIEVAALRLTAAPLVRVNLSTDLLESSLAESWSATPDNLIYTVKLRPGLATADGKVLTAADIAASLGPVAAMGQPVAVRATDAAGLEIRFSAPFAPGLRLFDRHPLPGLGPFIEEVGGSAQTGARTFRRNPHYWRKGSDGLPLPYLDAIGLTSAPAANGQNDFADTAIPAEDFEGLKKLEQAGRVRLFDLGPGLDADALWFSLSPPLADERPWLTSEALRLAISTAVDRREYCKQVFFGACDPMAGPVSPANVAWFNPDFPLGQANPQLARSMLAELGLRDRSGDGMLDDAARRPLRFSLLIRRDVPSSARAASFLANTLKAIGVEVEVTPLAAASLAARRRTGNYDAIYDRIEVHDTDPAMNLDFWTSSGAAHVWNPARRSRPADWERQIDELMSRNATIFDRAERLQAFVDAQKLYLQHMPAIFFGAPHVRIVTSVRTLNASPSPLRPHLLWNAESLAALK